MSFAAIFIIGLKAQPDTNFGASALLLLDNRIKPEKWPEIFDKNKRLSVYLQGAFCEAALSKLTPERMAVKIAMTMVAMAVTSPLCWSA